VEIALIKVNSSYLSIMLRQGLLYIPRDTNLESGRQPWYGCSQILANNERETEPPKPHFMGVWLKALT
jgi:hypothetical protein